MPKMDNIPFVKHDIEQNLEFFIEKFNKVADLQKWSAEQKCLQFCLTLPKEAKMWYLILEDAIKITLNNEVRHLLEDLEIRTQE
ncbi:hypothetical protein ACF0H5_004931 [Mactra antiquata]